MGTTEMLDGEYDPFGGLIPGYKASGTSLPSSLECEEAVLGAILLDPEIMEQAERLHPEHFYFERSKKLFATFRSLAEDGQPIDIRTVQAKLEREGQVAFDRCGGISYLATLDLSLPDIGRFDTYVEIVIELHAKRQLVQVAAQLAVEGRNGVRPREAIAKAVKSLEAILDGGAVVGEWAEYSDVQDAVLKRLEGGGYLSGTVPTGLPDIDKLLGGGLRKGKPIVLAARPGCGKSAFALQVVEHNACCTAKQSRIPCGIVSLEMKDEEQVIRLLARRSGIPYTRIAMGDLGDAWHSVAKAAKELHGATIFFESAAKRIGDILAKVRKLRRKHGCELFVIDYLGLVAPDDKDYENRTREIAAMTRDLVHFFSDEPEMAGLVVAQLNRESVKGGNRRPRLDDLAESGALERDAYAVGFLWRAMDESGTYTSEAEFLLPKHRNGETGKVNLFFDGPRMRFRCVEKNR